MKSIYCIEDNLTFNNYKEAAEHYGVTTQRIAKYFTPKAMLSTRTALHFTHLPMSDYEKSIYKNKLEFKH